MISALNKIISMASFNSVTQSSPFPPFLICAVSELGKKYVELL